MPAQPFTVHVDLDELARPALADAVPLPSALDGTPDARPAKRHHGDDRTDANRRFSARSPGAGKGRSYAFRRS